MTANEETDMAGFLSSVDEIDSGWLSRAMGRSVEIVSRERVGVGVGVLGQLARLRLDDGTSVIAKLPTVDPAGRGRVAGGRVLGSHDRAFWFTEG